MTAGICYKQIMITGKNHCLLMTVEHRYTIYLFSEYSVKLLTVTLNSCSQSLQN